MNGLTTLNVMIVMNASYKLKSLSGFADWIHVFVDSVECSACSVDITGH